MRPSRSIVATLATVVAAVLFLGVCTESDLRLSGPGQFGDTSTDLDPRFATADDVVDLALDDLAAYWTEQLPVVYGIDFEPLLGGEIAYGPTTEIPQCGPAELDYDDVAENALYCPDEDLIAWDRVALTPQLQEDFGPLTVGIVMSHEYAHAIQARAEVDGSTVTLELQADCFAGAWVADVNDRIAVFDDDGDSLDQAIGGFLELRDSVGVSGGDPSAHGSGFDRVSAFQQGYERGNDVCVTYEDDPPTVVAIPFGSRADQQQEGNLPLDELIEPLLADLESFHRALFADLGETWEPIDGVVPVDPAADLVECGDEVLEGDDLRLASFYCVADNTIYLDNAELVPSLDQIGDFAVGGEIARQYAFAAQNRLDIAGDDKEGRLHADCLTGVYAAAEFLQRIPDQQLVLSPGDIDEILIAFLTIGEDTGATAFQRTAAFRIGFVNGMTACASAYL
ncbi:neutral zinc metallopeptidase [Actinospongicola halichondriae]|uniref:neutral zinc metallopeptidase n=1 Tax=Actinospongicola halichondriae TaxID=3236844 RepID=UPI003D597BFE